METIKPMKPARQIRAVRHLIPLLGKELQIVTNKRLKL